MSVKSISHFLHGDVFSNRFNDVLNTYFSDQENLNIILHKILPFVYVQHLPKLVENQQNHQQFGDESKHESGEKYAEVEEQQHGVGDIIQPVLLPK